MATVGFLGLGNMGGPMAVNLVKAGHRVNGYDLSQTATAGFRKNGGHSAATARDAIGDAEVVITMLPAGDHVRAVYLGDEGILASAPAGATLIDCSTIDVQTARDVAHAAADAGFEMVDAPVSGGVAGAAAATLTFMVGGTGSAFAKAEPILASMGKNIVHAGDAGNGQAAKICNNMILGISMIGVCEAFVLAEKLGLDHQKLFDISSTASGQCWSLTSYCPVPGPVESAPSNRDYQPGFTAAMMLKDLKLAQQAAQGTGAPTPLGAQATAIYSLFDAAGHAQTDFSGIIRFLRGES